MSRLARPPFVLAHLADLAGCGFHRIIRPLQILGRNGILTGRAESQFVTDPVLRAIRPDVVVFQRQNDEACLEVLSRYRVALPDAFFVYEIDDALSAVPDKSWHKPYMPPKVDERTALAVALCDVVTVTTSDLADHMRSFCAPGTKIRIVPNMLGRDDFELAGQVRAQLPAEIPNGRLKIGWGGGIGHAGDLELLYDAMIELKDEVEWIFLGMDPEVPEGVIKIHAGTANPDRYLASLAAINVDLMVAPLEENLFNRCKSNLRLIEGGACSYPTIASPVAPYLTDSPPVNYASNTAEWVSHIRAFAALSETERKICGEKMFAWANRNYNMDDHAEKRLLGWLPENTRIFKPKLNAKGTGITVVRAAAGMHNGISLDLIEACEKSTADVLYLRGDVQISDEAIERLRKCEGDVVIPLSNDAGPWGFPNQNAFTSFDAEAITKIDKLCEDNFEHGLIPLSAAGGPVMLIRRSALAAVGSPDFEHLSSEVAMIDFSSAARARGLKVGICANVFAGVNAPFPPLPGEVETATLRITGRWPQGQNNDDMLKTVRETLELLFHRDFYKTLPPQSRNDYAAWVASCDTRGMAMYEASQKWLEDQIEAPVISVAPYPLNRSAAITGLDHADWLFFFPANAKTPLDAQEILTAAILENPGAKLLYADHDFVTPTGKRAAPDFKPNLDVHLLVARDYITQALAIRADVLSEILPLEVTEINECTLYAAALTLVHKDRASIMRVPHILASLPMPLIADAVATSDEKLAAAIAFTNASGWNVSIDKSQYIPVLRNIHYEAAVKDEPLVSIIIPCKDGFEMLAPCIATIESVTDYKNYEIIVVSNNTTRKEMLDFLDELENHHPKVTVMEWNRPFNWSRLNNDAVRAFAKGDFFCFLNDDTRVLSRVWLKELIGATMIPGVGAAGARLVYPHGQIQHVGVVCHKGTTGHLHKGLSVNSLGTNFYAGTSHESTAVTGACMMVKRDVFETLKGFDESFATNFNDVVFCIELRRQLGLVSLVANNAELQHFEGVTRNPKDSQEASFRILQEDSILLGERYSDTDPYWNPNLTFASIYNGRAIAGMDLGTFEFEPLPLPWKTDSINRVLVIGDIAIAEEEANNGASIYGATVTNNAIQITHPPMQNCGPWDIRSRAFHVALNKLDVGSIVLGDLGEMSRQVLSLLRESGRPIIYRPTTAEAVCPRQTLSTPKGPCNGGYERNECQACLDAFSSPHGDPSRVGWVADWFRFFTDTNLDVDLSRLTDPSYRDALENVYYQDMKNPGVKTA